MSEKPFWAGKTLMEIQNLDKRVKVTMENGDVFIGKLVRRSRDTDGICSLSMQLDAHRTYLHVFSAESSDTQPIIPSYVDTVELLDDPNYERIEEADDLQEKDIAVMLDGNRYKVTDVEKGRNRFWGRVYGAVGPECIALGFNAFTYGLRRGGHHVKEYDDGHCSSVLSAGFSWTHRLAVEPSDLEHHRLSGAYQL